MPFRQFHLSLLVTFSFSFSTRHFKLPIVFGVSGSILFWMIWSIIVHIGFKDSTAARRAHVRHSVISVAISFALLIVLLVECMFAGLPDAISLTEPR